MPENLLTHNAPNEDEFDIEAIKKDLENEDVFSLAFRKDLTK
jgi:hypothetical protein